MTLKVKICGMRDAENIKEVASLNPDYMGFIFYKNSPRYVGESFILNVLNEGIKKVGVFVNASDAEISERIDKYLLDVVQLHGVETPELCMGLKQKFPSLEIWKAFSIDDSFNFNELESYEKYVDKFLFDTKTPELGGSGKVFNWQKLKEYNLAKEIVLAGGIGPDNAHLVIELKKSGIQVSVVDINSKVETSPGIKSQNAVSEVMQALRNYD